MSKYLFRLTENIVDISKDTDLLVPKGTVVHILSAELNGLDCYWIAETVGFPCEYSFPVYSNQLELVVNHSIYGEA